MRTIVPRAERRLVSLRAIALGPSRDSDVELSDLSYSGCQIRSEDGFEPGELFELRVFKRGAIQAEVRWSAEGRTGAQFLN